MSTTKKVLWAAFFFLPLLFMTSFTAFGVVMDDYTPEVTARVIRISFLSGDVQIRRAAENGASTEWEKAALNLPLVEGDEISTGPNTLVEIQLDSSNHIRLSENAYLKFTTVRDEGIAVSLPQGTMSLRSLSFDKSRSYFEIDAPKTTFSIEKAGLYRIDAGDTRNAEITASAAEDGEAKVYTQSSGFTLRSGKIAMIIIDGKYAGDYETNGITRSTDQFDAWVLDRDSVIAKRLNQANYDKYYDRDIYGAEELSENGEWIYTKKYGYVWKPYANTTAGYSNWSPYRYGHWRWVPFYGWTWVNDEPWGWATYHHGRWIWDNGYWAWTPYGYHRWRRSWWSPAIVRIGTWNGSTICWYPLGYDDRYYDYNSGYRRNRRNNVTIINNNTTIIINPTPTPVPVGSPTPPVLTPGQINEMRRTNANTPTFQRIPAGAVITMNAEDFGKRTRGNQTASLETAKKVLLSGDNNDTPPILPGFEDPKIRTPKDILIENPRIDETRQAKIKTGASERESGKSLNPKLEQERIYGNRSPKIVPEIQPQRETGGTKTETRDTGAVTRQPRIKTDNPDTTRSPDFNPEPRNPTRVPSDNVEKNERREERKPKTETPPIYGPERETPKNEERRPTLPTFEPQREERKPQPQPEQRREEPKPQPKPEQRREEPKPQPKQEPAPKPESRPEKSEKDN